PVEAEPPQPERVQPPRPIMNDAVKKLLNERLALAREMADLVRASHSRGTVGIDAVLQANLRVLAAELELCDTQKERIAVLEKMVAVWKEIEDSAVQFHRQVAEGKKAVVEARLNRLEAQIALERARAMLVPPPK